MKKICRVYTKKEQNIITQKCKLCKEEKTLVNFQKSLTNKNGHRSYCKKCAQIIKKERQREVRIKVNQFKTLHGCKKCGNKRYYVLDFHHIDPSIKKYNISVMITSHILGSIWNEIDKCILLCKNCHQTFHHLERTEGLTLEEYLK